MFKTTIFINVITSVFVSPLYDHIRNLSVQVSEANLIGSGTSEHWMNDEGPQPKKAKVSWLQ